MDEQSWYYYLAEIALRQIVDRECPPLYPKYATEAWVMNIDHFASQCGQYDDKQIHIWYVDERWSSIDHKTTATRTAPVVPSRIKQSDLTMSRRPARHMPRNYSSASRAKSDGRHGGAWFVIR